MKIKNLELINFRNHKKRVFDFDEDNVLIYGPNGSGKTNVLESIHLLSTTKSLRAQYDREMISHSDSFAKITASVLNSKYSHKLEMLLTKIEAFENKATKKVKIDGTTKSVSKFSGIIKSVLFTPHDIEIFTQSPSVRRKYLDLIFFQIDESYKRDYSSYIHAVKQRNKVLEKIRDIGQGQDELDYWTKIVSDTGKKIQESRQDLLEYVQQNIPTYAKKLNKKSVDYVVKYLPNKINEERFEKYKYAEIASAKTLIGPHRDDFEIHYDGFNVGKYGSRGQKRTTLLAFKLCESDYIEKQSETRPILLLDDIFSELDEDHRETIENILESQQTIITSADKNVDLSIKNKIYL